MNITPTIFTPSITDDQRIHTYLRLSITDLCNFKCEYCLPNGYQGKKQSDELNLNEIKNLLNGAVKIGIKKVRITGGEPSLRKDLVNIIQLIKSHPGIEKVCITTNGYKISQHINNWIDAGIDQINISVDSLVAEHFEAITSSSCLPEIIQTIDRTIASGFHNIKINAVLLREHSHSQIQSILQWAKNKPIAIRFIELMQTNENTEYFNQQYQSADILRHWLTKTGWTISPREAHAGPAEEFHHSDFQARIGMITPYSNQFCDSCNRLRVTAQGQLQLCLFGENTLDLREYLQNDHSNALAKVLNQHIATKPKQHNLHQNDSGATRNFANIGG